MPHTIANEGEQTKLQRYKTIWKDADKIVDIMGFSTLGAWGPLATETLNTLFEDGPSWTEEHRVMFPYQRVVSDGGAAFRSKIVGACFVVK